MFLPPDFRWVGAVEMADDFIELVVADGETARLLWPTIGGNVDFRLGNNPEHWYKRYLKARDPPSVSWLYRRYVRPALPFCRSHLSDAVDVKNKLRFFSFVNDVNRLGRQLSHGTNALTKTLPVELVELIWITMKPVITTPKFRSAAQITRRLKAWARTARADRHLGFGFFNEGRDALFNGA